MAEKLSLLQSLGFPAFTTVAALIFFSYVIREKIRGVRWLAGVLVS